MSPVIRNRRQFVAAVLAVGCTTVIVSGMVGAKAASAAQPQVSLGTAASFAVLAGSTVTNTGPSSISGDLGLYPGTAITGFPPGKLTTGTVYVAPSDLAKQAQADLTTAYLDAAGRTPPTAVSEDLGGQTLDPGVYKASSSMGLTGTVTLDGQNDLSSVFVFQAGSTLITASSSTVKLIDGAQACNVFWQVGSSATLGTTTTFVGSVLALTSATLDTGAVVDGRILARNGAVTLDDNTITSPTCATAATTTTLKAGTTTTTTVARSTTTTIPRRSTTTTTVAHRSTTTTTAPKSKATPTTTSAPSTTTTTTRPAVGTSTTTTTNRPTTTTTVGSVTTTTAGGSVTTTTAGGAVTTTTAGGSVTTTTASPTTTTSPRVPSTTIPGSHTGEPWSGWPYWMLVIFIGLAGVAFLGRELLVRRRRT